MEQQGSSIMKIDLTGIIPFGVAPQLYPWGINVITEYIRDLDLAENVTIINYKEKQSFYKILEDNNEFLDFFFSLLKNDVCNTFELNEPIYLLSLVLAMSYLDHDNVIHNNIILKNKQKFIKNYNYIQEKVAVIRTAIDDEILKPLRDINIINNGSRKLFAITVYNGTILFSLHIAKVLKEKIANSWIIMGGAYFNFPTAEEIALNASWIDGIAVGYGENIVADIIKMGKNGSSIRDYNITGFVNNFYLINKRKKINRDGLSRIENKNIEEELKKINIPDYYHNGFSESKITLVKDNEYAENQIRLLNQRGCAHGKCSFCTIFDKQNYFPVSAERILKEFKNVLQQKVRFISKLNKSLNRNKNICVIFDTEENSADFLCSLLDTFIKEKDYDVKVVLDLWFQMNSFNKQLAEKLFLLKNRNYGFHFSANIESLNKKSLIDMKKGLTPLKAVEAFKIMLDCGVKIHSNYLVYFPLETFASVESEVGLLEKIMHLLVSSDKKIRVDYYRYRPNDRDYIYQNREKYNLSIDKVPTDIWIKECFGFDVPTFYWAYKINNISGNGKERIFNKLYYNFVELFFALKDRYSLFDLMAYLMKILMIRFFSIIYGNFSYLRRLKYFVYLDRLYQYKNTRKKHRIEKLCPKLYIKNQFLYKDYNVYFCRKRFRISLTENELTLLRFLYWQRSYNSIKQNFVPEISEKQLLSMINKFLKLGVIITNKISYLCIANDPEYWNMYERKS